MQRSLNLWVIRDGWSAELSHDPFLPIVKAIDATETLELGTNIAVAFARNPMLLANLGWDLQEYSGGRFILGLGTPNQTPHHEAIRDAMGKTRYPNEGVYRSHSSHLDSMGNRRTPAI